MTNARAMLEVRHLHAGYGAFEVLRGIDLEVGADEIVAVLGGYARGRANRSANLHRVLKIFPRLHERLSQQPGSMKWRASSGAAGDRARVDG